LFTDMRDWYGEMVSAGVLGRALIAVGRIDEGFAVLDASIRRADELSLEQAGLIADTQLVCAAAQAGMPERRRAGLQPPPPHGAPDNIGWVDWQVAESLLALQRGDAAEARERLEPVVADSPSAYAASVLA